MRRLTPRQVAKLLAEAPHWSLRGRGIRRVFACRSFADSVTFVGRVARAAEREDHHPDIDIRWDKVALTFTTHSKCGLTASDFAMARIVGAIFDRFHAAR